MKHCYLIATLALAACGQDTAAEAEHDHRAGTRPDRVHDAAADQSSRASGAEHSSQIGSGMRGPLLATVKEYVAVEPWFNLYRPEKLDATAVAMPIVVWANGVCSRSDFAWEILFQRWASAGFVVLALSEAPDDRAKLQTTVDDQAALVDWAVRAAEADDGPYFGRLAIDRIVAAGNSCGGATTLRLTARDPRVAAAFVLSGASGVGAADAAVIERINVPIGYVVGGEADVIRTSAFSDYEALPNGVPAMIVSRSEGDHRAVSLDQAILVDEAEIALHWMELAVFGSQAAHAWLTSPSLCEGCAPGQYELKAKHLDTLLR